MAAKKTTPAKPTRKKAAAPDTPGYLIRKWFLTGLAAAAPVAITIALIIVIVSFTDNLFQHLLPSGYEPAVLLGHEVPGLGLVVTFVGLTLIGALVSNFLGRYFIRMWDRMMARVPIVSGVYGSIKQIMNSVLSEQGQSFREVVYVEFPQPGQYAMGFVIGPADHLPVIENIVPMTTVFIPMVPVPTSGFLITLPTTKLLKSDMTVEEGLRMSVTMGLVKNSTNTK
jgi:uncharacterized membrane protein